MKSQEIEHGDVLIEDGKVTYTVINATVKYDNPRDKQDDTRHVYAAVRYADGGDGGRVWDYDVDVPLTRPRERVGK